MNFKVSEMIDNKIEFVRSLQETLKIDDRSNLDKLAYKVTLKDSEIAEEFIIVYFKDGRTKRLCTTANSNSANLKAVYSAIY